MPAWIGFTFSETDQKALKAIIPDTLEHKAEPEGLHMTLGAFPVETELMHDSLTHAAEFLADVTQPFKARPAGVGMFRTTEEHAPVVMMVDSPAVNGVRRWMELISRIYGLPLAQEKGFIGHVTLGKTASGVEIQKSAYNDVILDMNQLVLSMDGEIRTYPLKRGEPVLEEMPEPTAIVRDQKRQAGLPTFAITEQLREGRVLVEFTVTTELRGTYPNIALPSDVEKESLGADAFFVTLPLGQVNSRSGNNRTYTATAMKDMVDQINAQRPEGQWGHLTAEQLDTVYTPPAIRWLAAEIDNAGVIWGKGLPLNADTREYYRLAKATNARVGTSLQGFAEMDGDQVVHLQLLTVDIADPMRVGVPITAAKPVLSSDMQGEPNEEEKGKDQGDVMPPPDPAPEPAPEPAPTGDEVPVPAEGDPEGAPEPVPPPEPVEEKATPKMTQPNHETLMEQLRRDRDRLTTENATLTKAATAWSAAYTTIAPLLEIKEVSELPERIQDLLDTHAADIDAMIILTVENKIEVPEIRPLVASLIRGHKPTTAEQVASAFKQEADSTQVKQLLVLALPGSMGGNHRRGTGGDKGEDYFGLNDQEEGKK